LPGHSIFVFVFISFGVAIHFSTFTEKSVCQFFTTKTLKRLYISVQFYFFLITVNIFAQLQYSKQNFLYSSFNWNWTQKRREKNQQNNPTEKKDKKKTTTIKRKKRIKCYLQIFSIHFFFRKQKCMYAQTKQTQQATTNTSVTSNVHRIVTQNIYEIYKCRI
jgi:flagellar biosynthesis component FlhA